MGVVVAAVGLETGLCSIPILRPQSQILRLLDETRQLLQAADMAA
jgi:hypothetical protein